MWLSWVLLGLSRLKSSCWLRLQSFKFIREEPLPSSRVGLVAGPSSRELWLKTALMSLSHGLFQRGPLFHQGQQDPAVRAAECQGDRRARFHT